MKEIGPPKEGERWFVMLPFSFSVSVREIAEFTDMTVLLREPFPKDATERFVATDVRFIERVENGASK